mmetsp:Transcript_27051/g.20238  ORF Transcript_27051/g.20238 Transcript_27051/m.20238 type:complete len:166 (+) Transcript_27051:468-965(+)
MEFYNGCTKTIVYERQTIELDARTVRNEMYNKVIHIKPGYSFDVALTFKEEGHQQYRRNTTDLIVHFVEVLPDPRDRNFGLLTRFQRKEEDLIYYHPITLQQALNCEPAQIPTLDGRTLRLSIDEIVTPKTCLKVVEEGMPLYFKPSNVRNYLDPIRRGNLYVKF